MELLNIQVVVNRNEIMSIFSTKKINGRDVVVHYQPILVEVFTWMTVPVKPEHSKYRQFTSVVSFTCEFLIFVIRSKKINKSNDQLDQASSAAESIPLISSAKSHGR